MIPRRLAALALLLLAGFLLHRKVWVPHRCNVVKKELGTVIEREWERRHTAVAFDAGARNEPVIAEAVEHCPHDVALLMLAGSNQVLMNRYEAALRFYERALQHDRRPELKMAAGVALLNLGRREEALGHFVDAANFAGSDMLTEVPDAEVRFEAYRRYGERREKMLALRGRLDMRNLLENADFSQGARKWISVSEGGGTVSASIVPSQRRPGGNAMHVVTTGERSGLRQALRRRDRRPRVRTSATIFVNRGRVCIGSGNGALMQNACTTGTGRWERLEGVSESCPAEMTLITAASPGGADFIIDDVAARLAIGLPCDE